MTSWARRALKLPLLAGAGLRRLKLNSAALTSEVRFLIYHSIAGQLGLELDLNPEIFTRQMQHLAAQGSVIDYETALARLGEQTSSAGPGIVLTFDDGYRDFYTVVYPILQALHLPAILFVTSGFVEERRPYPMLAHPHLAVEPVTWEMLGEMAESGLVTLGAHTHTHPVLVGLEPERLEEEMVRPVELFRSRLGLTPRHFAYPRAEVDQISAAVVQKYYASAVIGGGHAAQPEMFDAYRIPRIPIRRSDGWWFFRAKLRGWLEAEESFYAWLHTLASRKRA